ncbi:hypothetical protein F8M41_011718 [Gigaspora margarita]|uniref:Uncharacterized protein n=1 Tax=Gigaspora margarita TaxID=4874 RepID=A0A8H4A0C8_GIGMA|nr:hypothetical protein F8M41_011718 [Gigaspora margarita]
MMEVHNGLALKMISVFYYEIASLHFFQDITRVPRKAEDLSQEEDHWIKSAYMAHGSIYWPIGQTNIEGHPVNHKCTRTFRYNPAGYYTHYNLQLAIDLGLHIELSSESPNALIFRQNQLMSEHDIFYQWASYLTTIKNEGGQAGKVAKHMLVSLWGRLYSDGRKPEPHRRMALFISARGRKIISEEIRPLGDCVKCIHTDGFIISGKATDQLLGRRYESGRRDLKIVNSGNVSIKNVMRLEWTNFEEIIPTTPTNSKKSTIHYISTIPNEIFERIFQYHNVNGKK